MASENEKSSQATGIPPSTELPASTAWPIVLAFGLALLFAGLVTSVSVSILGAVLAVAGCAGWFRQVLPHEAHETVPVKPEITSIITARPEVARIPTVPETPRRAAIPIETYPITAGIKGGLAGSVAMAVLAVLYGVVSHHSVWYPINLLAAVVYAQPMQLSMRHLTEFNPVLLLTATALHLVTSVLVGLLYGVLLPMFARRPILLGGFVAPILWSGLLHTSLGIINPLLNERINWIWFVISQIGFGIVAGLVVVRQRRVRTRQFLPFAVRAGIEAPGIMEDRGGRARNDEP
jgi:hypothetical protein